MKISAFIIFMLLFNSASLFSQVAINTDGSAADNSAILDVKSTTRGMLLPRMSQTEIEAIIDPANGLQVFCTTDSKMYIYVAATTLWKELAYGTATIEPLLSCGNHLSINHLVSGGVAPVDKTVTYDIVTNIPGETSKCWISSNLGADHQASAFNDATEASAGWYWQFNRMQGYNHDGTTLTPAWTITTINENLDWQAANDPCSHELGRGWRLPTYTEWTNVDASGNWTNWNGPWDSPLKIHAAGNLISSDGSLVNRGIGGSYWSSTQFDSSSGWYLGFESNVCLMNDDNKAFGFTVRCIRD